MTVPGSSRLIAGVSFNFEQYMNEELEDMMVEAHIRFATEPDYQITHIEGVMHDLTRLIIGMALVPPIMRTQVLEAIIAGGKLSLALTKEQENIIIANLKRAFMEL